jgi:hypothetical protein
VAKISQQHGLAAPELHLPRIESQGQEWTPMKLQRIWLVVWLAVALAAGAMAQGAAPAAVSAGAQPSDASADGAAVAPPSAPEREWVPDGIAALGHQASRRTSFEIERPLLELVSRLDGDNPDLRRVVAGVNGIAVRSYGFADSAAANPATIEAIGRQYQDAGWVHLVSKHGDNAGGTTDLWLRMEGATIRQIAVLLVRVRQVDFVAVSGAISPLDLLHLSGHFGIPKMDSGVAVPVPQGKP